MVQAYARALVFEPTLDVCRSIRAVCRSPVTRFLAAFCLHSIPCLKRYSSILPRPGDPIVPSITVASWGSCSPQFLLFCSCLISPKFADLPGGKLWRPLPSYAGCDPHGLKLRTLYQPLTTKKCPYSFVPPRVPSIPLGINKICAVIPLLLVLGTGI